MKSYGTNGDEQIIIDSDGFLIKSIEIFGFVVVFNCFVLEAQKELNKKLGHYEYLLLEKRSFPGSFVPGSPELPSTRI